METRLINFKDWKEDKKWVDLFEPTIKKILGNIFIQTAPERIDMKEATDLLVLELKPLTLACRVRRSSYYKNFKDEFTIRNNRPSGKKSELAKIISGWSDYYFYGFSNEYENGSGFIGYTIFDLKVFRRELIYFRQKKHLIFEKLNNRNGSSDFIAFKKNSFPPDFIIEESK